MKRDPASGLPIPRYAATQAARLFKRLEARMARAAKRRDAAAIHDLRVAIRRLAACLRIFAPLLPADRRVRRGLKEMMDLASDVRNCDIALDLSNQAGLAQDSPIRDRLARERRKGERKLLALMMRRARRGTLGRWRDRLEL
jgi:CHAD domain-containing protein